jgi:hypothetical protein
LISVAGQDLALYYSPSVELISWLRRPVLAWGTRDHVSLTVLYCQQPDKPVYRHGAAFDLTGRPWRADRMAQELE